MEYCNIPESTIRAINANDIGEVHIAAEGNNFYVVGGKRWQAKIYLR
jgi:hypothetical protein